uniref:PPM-type phosphatase domain-containing protein n=1 Tax=Marmota marmota marmota TaxID=9994 RepID=A0A8C5ZK90_MARMA
MAVHRGVANSKIGTLCKQPHGGVAASSGLRFGASAAQGWRTQMEDAHCAWLSLPGLPPGWAFFAIPDGHGGARVARFGARHLPGHVLEELGPAPTSWICLLGEDCTASELGWGGVGWGRGHQRRIS